MSRVLRNLLPFVLAVGLTIVFWWPLWQGQGLIGGDLYSYFMPQKQFFADSLANGEFPLWNNRTGHGYPLIAESQTGVLYPPNWLWYTLLEINTAYNVNQLVHYVLTFVACWLYVRRIGINRWGAAMAGLVYTYGWFPSRLCLEWAIIGGPYLPFCLWCVESYLRKCETMNLVLLSVAVGVQMLAGHFHLAFINRVLIVGYVAGRVWWVGADPDKGNPVQEDPLLRRAGLKQAALIGAAIALGFAIAAVQLLPTMELKQQSQRNGSGEVFDPGYGHIPPLYLTQTFASWWWWYAPEIDTDQAIASLNFGAIPSLTNKVEAHLYFGLIPLALVTIGWWLVRAAPSQLSRICRLWLLLGIIALIYSTGHLIPIARHLPGFGFFQGPGRYGIVTTLAVAVISGHTIHRFAQAWKPAKRSLLIGLMLVLTTADLWYVSRLVTYVTIVDPPMLAYLPESPIAKLLDEYDGPTRIWAPGQNLPNLLRTAQTPVYLGIGPQAYYDPALTIPPLPVSLSDQSPFTLTAERVDWLQQAGVTHILSFDPLDAEQWPIRTVFVGADPFLTRAWARSPDQPFFVYELDGTRGRAAFVDGDTSGAWARVWIEEYSANDVSVRVDVDPGEIREVVLTDLMYPGWEVSMDGTPAIAEETDDGIFRVVRVPEWRHTLHWRFRPKSLYWGAAISAIGLILLGICAWRGRSWFRRMNLITSRVDKESTAKR